MNVIKSNGKEESVLIRYFQGSYDKFFESYVDVIDNLLRYAREMIDMVKSGQIDRKDYKKLFERDNTSILVTKEDFSVVVRNVVANFEKRDMEGYISLMYETKLLRQYKGRKYKRSVKNGKTVQYLALEWDRYLHHKNMAKARKSLIK